MTDWSSTRTGRLDGAIFLAIVACGVGILVGNGVVLLSGIVGVTYTAYAYAVGIPHVEMRLERTLEPNAPVPGEEVDVTLTVENVGDRPLPDLRIVDGVPDALAVIDGSPACYTGLRPGDEQAITYSVRAKRGEYGFDPTTVIARNPSGTVERQGILRCESRVRCLTTFDRPPLHERALELAGQVNTNTGGSGVEFYATREYRPGDPMKRIDWHTLAKRNELKTVQYREQRAGTIVLLVDVRTVAEQAPGPEELDGRDLCVYAAEQALTVLTEHGNRVGVTFYGAGSESLSPGAGSGHNSRVRTHLAEHADVYRRTVDGVRAAGGTNPGVDPGTDKGTAGRTAAGADPGTDGRTDVEADSETGSFDIRSIERRIQSTAQVILFTPAVDDFVLAGTRKLQAYDHPVTVVSPDVTRGGTFGQRIEAIYRSARLQETRGAGAGVIDWNPNEPLSIAVGHAIEQWV